MGFTSRDSAELATRGVAWEWWAHALLVESESNRILGVSTAQWHQVDIPGQLQTVRLDAEGANACCFSIEQSIFAALPTPRIRLLSDNDCAHKIGVDIRRTSLGISG